jgi:hypothetical protein
MAGLLRCIVANPDKYINILFKGCGLWTIYPVRRITIIHREDTVQFSQNDYSL